MGTCTGTVGVDLGARKIAPKSKQPTYEKNALSASGISEACEINTFIYTYTKGICKLKHDYTTIYIFISQVGSPGMPGARPASQRCGNYNVRGGKFPSL